MTATGVAPADAAWVVVETPLTPTALAEFCADLERLYRINPYYEFQFWRARGAESIETAFRNLSNMRDFNLRLSVERTSDRRFTVHHDHGLKRATHFEIDAAPAGSRLKITDDYSGADTAADTTEADKSLHAWGVALHNYLQRHARWSKYAPWRWYMRRVWVPMKPAARRITFIIVMITLAELVLFALLIAIYWIEQRG